MIWCILPIRLPDSYTAGLSVGLALVIGSVLYCANAGLANPHQPAFFGRYGYKKLRARSAFGTIAFLILTAACSLQNPALPIDLPSEARQRVVLNEVLFLPQDDQPPFIELKATASGVSLEGLYLVNERDQQYALPDLPPLGAEEFLLIVFDGGESAEQGVVHARQRDFLSPDSGSLELFNAEGVSLDGVAWGAGQPGGVKLSRGGTVDELVRGTTIGRHPSSTGRDRHEWTIFPPSLATPGAANLQPGVEIMLPLNGAVISQTTFELSWYPAPGAVEYHVEVARDEAFTELILEETVSSPEASVELQAGKYFWRVQAIGTGGEPAAYSPVQSITVDLALGAIGKTSAAQQTTLGVPMIMQKKDTAMLLLESPRETGSHAWDVAHPTLDRSDPADNTNCTLASIAMINSYLGGDMSQDRIGYEIFKDFWTGPEYDLMYGDGLYADQQLEALTFALDAAPTFHATGDDLDDFWDEIKVEIDANRPVYATIPGHAFVITGYSEFNSTRIVSINDPWWGSYAADLDVVNWAKHFLISPDSIPVFQEPEITMHSDRDGVVDFDETQRFGTSPTDPDFDKDDVEDKDDIRASVFDEWYGYAVTGDLLGRDYDGDGMAMELDVDSDDGGCFDGMEDYDYNGKYELPETWNFEVGDDACFWGTDELVADSNAIYSDGNHHQRIRTFVTFSLRAEEEGKLKGLAQISYTWTGEFTSDICSGTHSVEPGYFQAQLDGTFQKLPNGGGTLVSFQATPDHGPSFAVQWVTNCPAEPTPFPEGWFWGGGGGTLVDGIYDSYVDYSGAVGYTEFWQKIHMEQGGAE